ncbi:MAG: serine hydrolase domain-containing protein [Candidatus Izemoplasmatales bacterium]
MSSLQKKLNAFISREINYWDFSGVIRVVKNSKIIFETSRGFSNLEFNVANTMQTRFTIGSMTKQFTGFSIMLLYDRGLLQLDEKANKYLPENMQIRPDITVHHLLTHTSGLYNLYNFEDDFFVGADRSPYNKIEYFTKWVCKDTDVCPGTKFDYNNSNYNLLAWIIEYVSKAKFSDFIHENIFKPLDMRYSEFDDGKTIIKQKAENYMYDYDKLIRAPYTNNLFHIGAGALVTNCDDLQRWYLCLKNRELLSQQAYTLYFKENLNHYCYGLERHNINGAIRYSHGGDYLGVSTYMQNYFEDDICIIILSNAESLNQYRLGNSIADILYGMDVKPSLKLDEYPVSITELENYCGTYLPGKIQMEVRNGKLYLIRTNWDIHIEFYCVGHNAFMKRFEEQQEPRVLLSEEALKPSMWGYELVSKELI